MLHARIAEYLNLSWRSLISLCCPTRNKINSMNLVLSEYTSSLSFCQLYDYERDRMMFQIKLIALQVGLSNNFLNKLLFSLKLWLMKNRQKHNQDKA